MEEKRVSVAAWWLGAALAAVLLTGCGRSLRPPEVSLAGLSFGGGDTVRVSLAVRNPNAMALRILDVDYCIAIAGETCGRGRRGSPLLLRPQAEVTAEFPVAVDFASLGRLLPAMFLDTVDFRVAGTLTVPVFLGRQRLPFASSSRVDVKSELEGFMHRALREPGKKD